MEHTSAAPFVTELNRLLGLRSRWHEEASTPETRDGSLTEGDLLALAFLISELDVATLLVDDPDLSARLERAGLAAFVEDRAHRPLRIAPLPDADAGPAVPASCLCLDARHGSLAAGRAPWIESVRAVVLYGLRQPVALSGLGGLEVAFGDEAVVISLAGRALAFWNASALLVVPRALAGRAEDALGRLTTLLADRSLDPLHLAQSCVDLQKRLRLRGDDEATGLRTRMHELEDEIADLKARLLKQQRALAIYNEKLAPGDRAGRGALPESGTTP